MLMGAIVTIKKGSSLYLSGPMTGILNKNFYAFHRGYIQLRNKGYKVIDPWALGQSGKMTWSDFLRRDLKAMMEHCGGVATLPGWKKSKGASLEVYIAKALGWPVHTVAYWVKWGKKCLI